MKKQNKTIILGAIAIVIIIIIIIMTFFYVNDIREKQLEELEEQKKEEISLTDQIENLTYYLDLYRGEDLIYGEGKIIRSGLNDNNSYLLLFDNLEYYPNKLPDQFKQENLTISFIASVDDSMDSQSGKQKIQFLRINETDIQLSSK
jgi:flagellar biosynthesis/type III secretory pathway M-ring protein FliF/YscJ